MMNYAGWQRAMAFVICAAVIVLVLPSQKLFKYEYQLSQPWKHDKLIAPFEFGILKSDEALSAERQLLTANHPKVFEYDAGATDAQLQSFWRYLESHADTNHSCDSLGNEFAEQLSTLLSSGIPERANANLKDIKPLDEIKILQDGKLQRRRFRELLTLQQASDSIRSMAVQVTDSACRVLLMNAALKALQPNAFYNDSLHQKLLLASLEAVIEIEGRIEKGTAIIDRGDIVDERTHQVLESLRKAYDQRSLSSSAVPWAKMAEIGIMLTLLGLLALFVRLNRERIFNDPRPMTFTLSLVTISFVLSSLALQSETINLYVIPLGITPLLLRMFYDFRISLFAFYIAVLIVAMFTPNPLEFTIIQVSAISFATLYQAASTRRSRILMTAALVFVGYSAIYTLLSLAQNGDWTRIETSHYGWFAINALMCTLVFPLIYLVEKLFGYLSDTTLMELSESSQPLLKELAIKAPGTFQHSLQVANLCEKVAQKIGGDPILLRAGAMYHDVGKMNEPQFFIENQLPDNNPHDDLEPEESASIILNHVIKGVEMAKAHKLPLPLVQFMQTHHGTSRVRFFLKKALDRAALTGDQVNEEDFRYPGPTPKTKEQAILMMADSVEAASRSLKKFDQENIDALIDRIIDHQQGEGQFEEAPITYKDISDAKAALKAAVHGIYHQRISYD